MGLYLSSALFLHLVFRVVDGSDSGSNVFLHDGGRRGAAHGMWKEKCVCELEGWYWSN